MLSERLGSGTMAMMIVAVGLATVGCGGESSSGPDGSSQAGSFELSYSGDTSGTISGVAIVFNAASTGSFFAIAGRDFSEAPDADTGFNLGRSGPPPAPGTYDLTAFGGGTGQIFGLSIQVDSNGLVAEATGGTVTFTDVNSDRVQGEFSATLTGGMQGDSNITLTATGTFDAVSCEDNVQNCPQGL